MKWSLKLGSYSGIGIYLHWTFLLLIGWIYLMHLGMGQTPREALVGVGFILALFGCVLLHEFGHALMAKRYGVGTRDITLLPIGGVARLECIPEKPMQEFWVAVAGPAVNVAIAAVLFLTLLLQDRTNLSLEFQVTHGGFLTKLMWVNLFIVAFNMLPAFPMDGGRVLRALLSIRIGRSRATVIAANIGQMMAILFVIVGFVSPNPFLIFIAIMVYLGAQAEASHVEIETVLEGLRVRDAMVTHFRTLSEADSLTQAAHELLAGAQQDFPVVQDGTILLGLLRRDDLIKALADGRRDEAVGDVMCRECSPVNESDILITTMETMSAKQCSAVPVLENGRVVGLLTMDNIGELIMINPNLDNGLHTEDHPLKSVQRP